MLLEHAFSKAAPPPPLLPPLDWPSRCAAADAVRAALRDSTAAGSAHSHLVSRAARDNAAALSEAEA